MTEYNYKANVQRIVQHCPEAKFYEYEPGLWFLEFDGWVIASARENNKHDFDIMVGILAGYNYRRDNS